MIYNIRDSTHFPCNPQQTIQCCLLWMRFLRRFYQIPDQIFQKSVKLWITLIFWLKFQRAPFPKSDYRFPCFWLPFSLNLTTLTFCAAAKAIPRSGVASDTGVLACWCRVNVQLWRHCLHVLLRTALMPWVLLSWDGVVWFSSLWCIRVLAWSQAILWSSSSGWGLLDRVRRLLPPRKVYTQDVGHTSSPFP